MDVSGSNVFLLHPQIRCYQKKHPAYNRTTIVTILYTTELENKDTKETIMSTLLELFLEIDRRTDQYSLFQLFNNIFHFWVNLKLNTKIFIKYNIPSKGEADLTIFLFCV